MRKVILAVATAAMTLPLAAPVLGDPPPWAPAHGRRDHDRHYYRTDNGIRYWRDERGHYRCHRSDGTTGTLIGGVAGALVGRSIDTEGDRTTGTVLGAAAGALVGHSIDKNSARCR